MIKKRSEIAFSLWMFGRSLRAIASSCTRGNLGWILEDLNEYESDQTLEQSA